MSQSKGLKYQKLSTTTNTSATATVGELIISKTSTEAMKSNFMDLELTLKLFTLIIYFLLVAASLIRVKICYNSCEDSHIFFGTIVQAVVSITIPISMYHIWDHLSNFIDPRLQKQVIRIIWLIPMFSIESYLSITFVQYAVYFQSIREIYEAYSLYCFMYFLLSIIGTNDEIIIKLSSLPSSMSHHRFPCCCLTPWNMGFDFLIKCKMSVFQYVFIRFINCCILMILFTFEYYFHKKYLINQYFFIYFIIMNFFSQSFALYSLILFFFINYKELKKKNAFLKFLCLKIIFFLSFWQNLILNIFIPINKIHLNPFFGQDFNINEVILLIRALLISIEMLIASILFLFIFPIHDYCYGTCDMNNADSKQTSIGWMMKQCTLFFFYKRSGGQKQSRGMMTSKYTSNNQSLIHDDKLNETETTDDNNSFLQQIYENWFKYLFFHNRNHYEASSQQIDSSSRQLKRYSLNNNDNNNNDQDDDDKELKKQIINEKYKKIYQYGMKDYRYLYSQESMSTSSSMLRRTHDIEEALNTPSSSSSSLKVFPISPHSAFTIRTRRLINKDNDMNLFSNSTSKISTIQRRLLNNTTSVPIHHDRRKHIHDLPLALSSIGSNRKMKCDTPSRSKEKIWQDDDIIQNAESRRGGVDYEGDEIFNRMIGTFETSSPITSPIHESISLLSTKQSQSHQHHHDQQNEINCQQYEKSNELEATSVSWITALSISGPSGAMEELIEDLEEFESQLKLLYSNNISNINVSLLPQIKKLTK